MARSADPILIPPASTTEASLRIQEAIPGAEAKGHVEFTVPNSDLIPLMYGGQRPEPLLSWEFGSVDVTEFCAGLGKNRDGTLKHPAPTGDSSGFADPMLYDDYCHEDVEGDEVVFTVPDKANPHFGSTGPRPVEPKPMTLEDYSPEVQAAVKASAPTPEDPERITDEQLLKEFEERTGIKVGPTQPGVLPGKPERDPVTGYPLPVDNSVPTISPEELARYPRRKPYEPMKSGVWINAAENEDDIKELHPTPEEVAASRTAAVVRAEAEKPDPLKEPQRFYEQVHGSNAQFEGDVLTILIKQVAELTKQVAELAKKL